MSKEIISKFETNELLGKLNLKFVNNQIFSNSDLLQNSTEYREHQKNLIELYSNLESVLDIAQKQLFSSYVHNQLEIEKYHQCLAYYLGLQNNPNSQI